MDPDQTAPTLFVYEASNILVENKKNKNTNIMIMCFNG